MPSGDNGYLYFEIRGSAGSLSEGGLDYYSDSSIAPYQRVNCSANPGGFCNLTNGSARFIAGELLAIFHGVTQSGSLLFTNVGGVPDYINPQTAYVTSQEITLINSAWIFDASQPDTTGIGTDPAGNYSPCMKCSVSQLTTIAQSGATSYAIDGAYFGVDDYGDNTINWMQVAFGNWGSDCEPGTTLCQFYVSNNPFVYYGGPQYYPNDSISQSDYAVTGYGPYETYDGIDLTGISGSSVARKPLKAINEPLPPAVPTPAPTPICSKSIPLPCNGCQAESKDVIKSDIACTPR